MLLHITNVQDYHNWIDLSPATILNFVKNNGGWVKAFPRSKEFPVWASRLRNYFNVTPTRLTRLDVARAARLAKSVQTAPLL